MVLRLLQLSVLAFVTPAMFGQDFELPTDPLEGRIVFEEKQCISCHSVGGLGGTAGPDLSRDYFFGSGLELASILWNHTPAMNRKFRQLRMDRPKLSEKEMLDLLGFLYYLRYLGEPGSVSSGKRLIESKGCLSCHTIGGGSKEGVPDFRQIPRFSAPLNMVQAMWNHAPTMQKKFESNKVAYPTMSGEEAVDIAAFLQQASTAPTEQRLSPGNPRNGRVLFDKKKCSTCHVGEGKRRRIETGLVKMDLRKGVTEVASLMWNHGKDMFDLMKRESIEWPMLEGNDMADIIAYIYFLGFEDKPGQSEEGLRVFREKGCFECHERSGSQAALLASSGSLNSPFNMVQLMWNHAIEMEDLLITQNKRWPELSSKEMRDLYAYLQGKTKK